MKKEIRILGIDDASFDKFKDKRVLVIGTVFRGGSWLDGIITTYVRVDGTNSTKKLVEMINGCKFKPQLQFIMLDGIALGGFNIVDVVKLNKETAIPVIVVMRNYPDFKKIERVLRKLGKGSKIKLLKKAGEVIKIDKIHVQLIGVDYHTAKKLLKISCTRSHVPEPIRVAHLIGQGIAMGESRGRA